MGLRANSVLRPFFLPSPSFAPAGGCELSSTIIEQAGSITGGENPMRDTEIVLNSFDTDTRETPTQGRSEHHDNNQRSRTRGRGEHGSVSAAPSARRPPRGPPGRAAAPPPPPPGAAVT